MQHQQYTQSTSEFGQRAPCLPIQGLHSQVETHQQQQHQQNPPDWQHQLLELGQRLQVLEQDLHLANEDLDLAHAETVVAQQNEAAQRSHVRLLQNNLNSYAAPPPASPSNLGDSSSDEVTLL